MSHLKRYIFCLKVFLNLFVTQEETSFNRSPYTKEKNRNRKMGLHKVLIHAVTIELNYRNKCKAAPSSLCKNT